MCYCISGNFKLIGNFVGLNAIQIINFFIYIMGDDYKALSSPRDPFPSGGNKTRYSYIHSPGENYTEPFEDAIS
jgi:hypothetical protein